MRSPGRSLCRICLWSSVHLGWHAHSQPSPPTAIPAHFACACSVGGQARSTASFCVDTCAPVLVCWFWLQPFPALAAGKPGALAVGPSDAGFPGRVPSPAWWQTWREWPLLADKCLSAVYSHYLRKLVDSPLLFPVNPAPLWVSSWIALCWQFMELGKVRPVLCSARQFFIWHREQNKMCVHLCLLIALVIKPI